MAWDPWTRRWSIACRAPPVRGAANQAVRELVALWLRVPVGAVRWISAGRARAKELEIEGLAAAEVEERLRDAAGDVSGAPVSRPARVGSRR